jgi:hypothetical protein
MEQTNRFIGKATAVHGDKYGYKNVNYINSRTDILITCKKHGDFKQQPSNHLMGKGCSTCGYDATGQSLKSSTNEFIIKAKEKHGDLYDYSKDVYIKSMNKVIITCVNCKNEFEMSPNMHISRGDGCKLCSRQIRKKEIFM